MAFSWRNALSSLAPAAPRNGRPRTAPQKSRRPALFLERLEDRCVPATFNVNTLLDLSLAAGVNSDGTIKGQGNTVTLRSAVQAANNTPGDNTINLTVGGDYQLTLQATTTNVVGVDVTSGGSGYTSAPLVGFTGGGTGAAGFATINAAGVVTSVTVTNGGTGYTTSPTINFTGGGGTGASVFALRGEDDNAAGELVIQPTGGNLVIQNTSGKTAVIDGNSALRVLDINPNFSTPAKKSTVTISGVTITNGVASLNDFASGSGGGVRDQGPISLTLTNDIVTNNSATADGGGVSMENPFSTPWTLTLNNTTVTYNRAGDAGGGVETDGSGNVFINAGSLIAGNTAVNQGGGVWLDAAQPLAGGALTSANLTITGALVGNNSAYMVDGGIGQAGNSNVIIANSTVENNFSAGAGGGFGDQNNLGTLGVEFSYFLNNTAVADGGGIQEGGPSTTITDTEIKGNSSNASGGGVFANGFSLSVMASTIADNTAAVAGGGLEVDTSAAQSVIGNTTITGNQVLNNGGNGFGGGVYASAAFSGLLALANDTINGNFADTGGGLFNAGGAGAKLELQNTIVAQNTADVAGPDAIDNNGNTLTTFVDFGGNIIGTINGTNAFTAATTQIGVNPFLGPLTNNLGPLAGAPGASIVLETEAIAGGSPALDKGVATTLTTDERGFPRPDHANSNPDVGAFELQDSFVAINFATQGVSLSETANDGADGGVFQSLTPANATLLAVNASGQVAAEFPGYGVDLYSNGVWTSLTSFNATLLGIDAAGDVFGKFAGYSIQVNRGGVWSFLPGNTVNATLMAVDARGDVAAELSGYGVFLYTASANAWVNLTPANASLLAIDNNGDVFADLVGAGVFRYANGAWTQLTTQNATKLSADDLGDVAADFTGYGVFRFTAATSVWTQLGTPDANALAMDDDGDIFASFPGQGMMEYSFANASQRFTTQQASVLSAS